MAAQTQNKSETQAIQQQIPPVQTVAQQATQLPPIEPEKELFFWTAPERPFKKREKQFWVKVFAISSIFGFILFLVEGAMPVILLIAVLFLFYILSTVEPPDVRYAVTNRGVKVADKRNDWEILTRFWFGQRLGRDLLVFEMIVIPGRLELVINSKDKEKLREILGKYILEEEAPPTNMDKAAGWLSQKLSLS